MSQNTELRIEKMKLNGRNSMDTITKRQVICDVCGEKCGSNIGVGIGLTDMNDPDIIRVKETFGKLTFNICLRCWILAMGVPPYIQKSITEKRDNDDSNAPGYVEIYG